ncbi:MAG TPA: metalloregulator ArsR/SmtB family transcription factor [Candidatus Dormibacteraeota bacterium]|nr:metalloregulator ArsR/SmtB family transcription factor [Candidatus Dormibacteraeota bacterium]
MVEYALNLDYIFSSLADPTRRDIMRRVSYEELSVGEIAKPYDLTFAAVSKHLKVLEKAKLIIKRRRGKEQMVRLSPQTLADVDKYLEAYRRLWEERLDSLENYLNEGKE